LKWQPWRGAQFILNQAYINNNAKNQNIALAAPRLASSLSYFQKLPGGLDFSLMHQDSGTMNLQGDNGALVAMNRTDLRLALPLRVGANRGELALVIQNMGSPNPDFVPGFAFNQRAFVTLRIEN
jgi:iron complex outermembrane receptor protein